MVAKSHPAVEADLQSATDPLLGGLAYQKEAAPCPAPPPDRTTTIRREVRRRVSPAGARPRRPATRRPVTARRRRTPALPVLPLHEAPRRGTSSLDPVRRLLGP